MEVTPSGLDNTNVTLMENVTVETKESQSTLQLLRVSIAIPLVIMATFGNGLSFIIMGRPSWKNTSTGIYFAAIACMDTTTVYWGLLPFIVYYFTSTDLWTLHPWSCKIVIFILFTSADSAVWLLLAVTVDRLIAVKFPVKKLHMCTPKRAMTVALVLPPIAILKNVHLFYTRGIQVVANPELPERKWTVNNCGYPSPAIEFFENYIRTWIGFSLYAFIPISSVFILNVLIIHTVSTKRRISADLIRQSNNHLTAMLLTVSFTFLILIIPSITVIVIKPYLNLNNQEIKSFAYLEAIVDSLVYLMHSSNFLLYCLTGPGFRLEFNSMVNNLLGRNSLHNSETIRNIRSIPTVAP